jgi:DNA-binding MarR family transcriptional regulator
MARSIARLEKAGLVRRASSPTDRRATIIEATEASLALRHRVETAWARLERATVGSMSRKLRSETLRRLADLEANLAAVADHTPPESS